jgi:hypothetical protein
MTHPRKPRGAPRPQALDPALDEKQEALLHMPPALLARLWQDAAGCPDEDCPTCRLSRALTWVNKAAADIDMALLVTDSVLLTLPFGEKDDPIPVGEPGAFNPDLATVAARELQRLVEGLSFWAMTLGHACGARVAPKGAMTLELVGEDDTTMTVNVSVPRRQRGKSN